MTIAAALYLDIRSDPAARRIRKSLNLIYGTHATRSYCNSAGSSDRCRVDTHIGSRNASSANLRRSAAPDLRFEALISLPSRMASPTGSSFCSAKYLSIG